MSIQSDIVQINRGLEQYARTFTTDSAEYADLEFQLSRLLGYPQIDRENLGRRFSRSKQFDYDPQALREAKKLVQGTNTAAAQAQAYYGALQDADTEITQSLVRKLAVNKSWIASKQHEIYVLLASEYGEDWEDSDTRKAYFNAYDNDPRSLYKIISADAEYRKEHGETETFIENITRIRQAIELNEEQVKEYARKRRAETRRSRKYTNEEMQQMFGGAM